MEEYFYSFSFNNVSNSITVIICYVSAAAGTYTNTRFAGTATARYAPIA